MKERFGLLNKNRELIWKNGKLVVSEEGRYLKHENGVPFFWLGETGWLMPQRLNRDEVSYCIWLRIFSALPALLRYSSR